MRGKITPNCSASSMQGKTARHRAKVCQNKQFNTCQRSYEKIRLPKSLPTLCMGELHFSFRALCQTLSSLRTPPDPPEQRPPDLPTRSGPRSRCFVRHTFGPVHRSSHWGSTALTRRAGQSSRDFNGNTSLSRILLWNSFGNMTRQRMSKFSVAFVHRHPRTRTQKTALWLVEASPSPKSLLRVPTHLESGETVLGGGPSAK